MRTLDEIKHTEKLLSFVPVMKAYKQGKQVQYSDDEICWIDCRREPVWDSSKFYRVKPEPKIVPFDQNDAVDLIGKSIRHKNGREIYLIIGVDSDGDYLIYMDSLEPIELLNHWVFFPSNKPCGKEVTE